MQPGLDDDDGGRGYCSRLPMTSDQACASILRAALPAPCVLSIVSPSASAASGGACTRTPCTMAEMVSALVRRGGEMGEAGRGARWA